MTHDLFRADSYLRECSATVTALTPEGGVVLDRTVFYPLGGGQAGDAGVLLRPDGTALAIADTRKGKDAEGRPTADIVHVPAPGQALEDHLYIVDPLGEWMMRAPADADPNKLKRDIDRLLRASASWDKAGRQALRGDATAAVPDAAASRP